MKKSRPSKQKVSDDAISLKEAVTTAAMEAYDSNRDWEYVRAVVFHAIKPLIDDYLYKVLDAK